METRVLAAEGIEGVVLRYGWFYGPGTYFAEDGSTASDVRRRRYPIVGNGGGLFSFIHLDDAAPRPLRHSSAARPASTTS
jgi:2-alkyl-3-oxoalkanoate reductase